MTIKEFMTRWFTDKPSKVLKLHISHTDLDGFACFVVEEAVNRMADTNLTFYKEIAQTPKDVGAAIQHKLDELRDEGIYEPGVTTIDVLVTDLAPSPYTFRDLSDHGHRIRYYAVIDHHQNHHGYKSFEGEGLTGIYGIETDRGSAARLFLWRIMDVYHPFNDEKHHVYYNYLSDFANGVSNFDTGNWGHWADISVNNLDVAMYLQLVFAYDDHLDEDCGGCSNRLIWMDEHVNFILDGPRESSQIDFISYYYQTHKKTIKLELEKLRADYKRAIEKLEDLSMTDPTKYTTLPLDGKFIDVIGPAIKVMTLTVEPEDEPYYSFSLISKEILEVYDPTIGILMEINYNHKAVHLRSACPQIDVSKIAYQMGGGGHPRAAGFPFPEQ